MRRFQLWACDDRPARLCSHTVGRGLRQGREKTGKCEGQNTAGSGQQDNPKRTAKELKVMEPKGGRAQGKITLQGIARTGETEMPR